MRYNLQYNKKHQRKKIEGGSFVETNLEMNELNEVEKVMQMQN